MRGTPDFKSVNYSKVIAGRARRLKSIRADKSQKKLTAMLRHYEKSPTGHIDFVLDWGMTCDPRLAPEKPTLIPFILFERQIEYLDWLLEKLVNKEDGLAEKSRDVGFTWLNVVFSVWLWRFVEGAKVGFGSRKEALVDKLGDPDSIFEKIRLYLRYLPPEMLPYGFRQDKHTSFLKIINPDNGSTITGEAGDNIGRGGRNTIYFKDESAFYERPLLIDAALSQNCDVKIDCSTVNGVGNPFYTKRFGGAIDVFIFDWREDPRKDQEWYDKQVAKESPATVAQEIDRDYHASMEGVVIPASYIKAAVGLKIEASGAKIGGLDVADNDGTGDDNAFVFRHGVVLNKNIRVWTAGNTTDTTRRAHGHCQMNNVEHLNYDNIGVGAGVKGELSSLDRLSKYRMSHTGINFGSKKLPGLFRPDKKNVDMFANKKAFLWWELRMRFERTYEHVNEIKQYPVDKLISIPNNPRLIAQLSTIRYETNEAGKIQIVSKKKMKLLGIQSPNEAEAVVYCYAPTNISTATLLSKSKRLNRNRRAA